jgi:MFS family permease
MGAVVVGLGGGAFWSLAMKYGADRGLDQGGIAFFMTAAIMGGALAHWPLGRASDFTDRRIVIMFAAGVAATASAGLASAHLFGEWARWAMFAAAFLYGASAFPIGSLANAHLNDRAHANDVSETASGILLVYGCAAAIGPFAGALMMQTAGPSGLFLYTATVQFAYLMFVLVRMLQRGPAEHETPASAVALPGSSLADDAVSRSGP